MELYYKILAEYFAEYGYPDEKLDREKIIRDRCYLAVCRIRGRLEGNTMEDPECFWRIERVVNTLEELGLDAGNRHDFG